MRKGAGITLDRKKLQETGLTLLITVIALLAALLVGALVIWAFGSNPIEAYGALWQGAFGTGVAFTVTLGKAVPVMLTGLAVAVAFKCSVFNIGAEGQLLMGAMAAALVGAYVHLPMALHLPLTILASMAAGMAWSFFPAILKRRGNVSVVISTIMFNYIAQYLVQYLILGPFKGPGESPATATIDATAQLPALLPKPYVLNLGFVLALAAVDGLYLAFLAVQSAGLFGGPEYVESLGVSYAEWARSGFFQMVGVTVLNLSLTLASLCLSRREGRAWRALRQLCGLLAGESLILLASAAWKMTLYVSAYGLSFKRCMTYWGMIMMALFLLAGLWKALRPDFRFCKWAFPVALAGWLVINCVPVDYLVAKNQVDRYLKGESPTVSVNYLAWLSFDTLSQLERLDGSRLVSDYDGNWDYHKTTLSEELNSRRVSAWAQCRDWRTWSLSACLAAGRE